MLLYSRRGRYDYDGPILDSCYPSPIFGLGLVAAHVLITFSVRFGQFVN